MRAAIFGLVAARALWGEPTAPVTFYRDVVPVLQKQCQSCHRPGEVAPMSFLTYEETRPWAKAIKAAVLAGKMPPWFAHPLKSTEDNETSFRLNRADAQAPPQ